MVNRNLVRNVVLSLFLAITTILLTDTCYAQDGCTPSISQLTPNLGPSWMSVTISGDRFGATLMKGDMVLIGSQEAPIRYWSDTLIEFKVPVGISSGVYNVTVTKVANPLTGCGDEVSNPLPFEVTARPSIIIIDPTESTCRQQLDIYGRGFGRSREKGNPNGFGYSTYVELYSSRDTYRVTKYPDPWLGPDHIKIWLQDLLDVNTGLEVADEHLYHGIWDLRVISDYFIEDADGLYNRGLGGLDAEDELLCRAISNPVSLNVTPCDESRPVIYFLTPSTAPASQPGAPSKVVVRGVNFGETQGISEFHIGERTWYEGQRRIRLWSDNRIKFKVPRYRYGFPKHQEIWVTVGGTDSNKMMLTVLEP
jgi:hypothetical protein